MKALSIKQPWLYCITDSDKQVENRTWEPPRWIIGERIALHASGKLDSMDGRKTASRIAGVKLSSFVGDMPLGAIVGTARLSQCFLLPEYGGRNRQECDKWSFGPFCWVLSDIKKLSSPLPCKGTLGLWDVPPGIAEKIQ